MSNLLWRALIVSPAVLGATLLISAGAVRAAGSDSLIANDSQKATATVQPQAPEAQKLEEQSQAIAPTTETTSPEAKQQPEFSTAATAASAQPQLPDVKLPSQVSLTPSQLTPANPTAHDAAPAGLPQSAPSLAQSAPAPGESNNADVLNQINRYSREGNNAASQDQVTNVSQLSDVRPTDWAYEALRSLVERYGCIAGYPDGTFRGNRAMTRYEFAAGLNACLDKVSQFIQGSRTRVMREDLASMQRLQEEFAAELATLRGRVDVLEARASELEANQFSTTTKLNGEVIFALTGIARGDDAEGRKADRTTAFGSRVRLNFDTSFSGKDLLRTRLQVLNLGSFSTNNTKTAEGELRFNAGPFGEASNTVGLDALLYQFPLGKNTTVILEANAGAADDFTNTVNPYFDGDGAYGALSNFGTRNPIYYLTAGSGIAVRHQFGDKLELSLGYLAGNAANPTQGNGLFNGSYGGLAQLTFKPSDSMILGLTYVNSYNFVTGTGSNASNFPVRLGSFGIDSDSNVPVSSNSYGAEASWRLNRGFAIGGWAGYTNQRILSNLATPTGSVQRGDQKIWNWAVTLAFPDLLKEGNVAGIVVGMEPRVTSSTNRTLPEDKDTSLHVEGFYQFKLSDNISITPGLIWLTAPDHNKNNSDLLIGVVRTTFTF